MKKNSRKYGRIFLSIMLFTMIMVITTGCEKEKNNSVNGERIKITPAESSKKKLTTYDNGLVKMKIPKGWKVEVPKSGFSSYTFKVYNPKNTNYMYLFAIRLETAATQKTTEEFYKDWNKTAKKNNEENLKKEFFPYFNDYTIIENFGKTNLGGELLRATYKNDKGELQEGIFTTTISSSSSKNSTINAYHTIMMMTPDAELMNYQEIYNDCIGSITFTDSFIEGFSTEEQTMVENVQANKEIYDELSNMIMNSWNKRDTSYDIISQKRSDAALGDERVYNAETNEIYKAYSGFMDDYKGIKYEKITEDMYTRAISGYITK